jgi:hypothetical protein
MYCTGVGIATGYGMDDRGVGFHVSVGSRILTFPYVQAAIRAHPASYPMSTGGYIPRDKAAEAWSWPLISN